MVCHTTQGGREFAGGLGFKLPFGTLYSTNITPDKETGIGNYSDQDFLNAVHRGKRRDGAWLYPAMPYTSYTYITDADALAIKAYLFSLAPVRAPAPENTLAFPFNQRWAMSFWSALFNPDTRFEPDPSKSPEWNRGAYLAEALAHCGECHTPRNLAFALDNRKKFAGAVTAGWRAYNISSDKATGVGGWRDEDLVSYLSTGHATGHGTASGPMGEAVDHSFSQMAPEDIRAMVAYLRSVPPTASTDLPATVAPPAPASHRDGGGTPDPRGKMVFEGACVSCHGWTGESAISPFATLTGAWAVNDPEATNVAQIVISGTKRHTPEGAVSMPAFGNAYSDDGDRSRGQLRHRALRSQGLKTHCARCGGASKADIAVAAAVRPGSPKIPAASARAGRLFAPVRSAAPVRLNRRSRPRHRSRSRRRAPVRIARRECP